MTGQRGFILLELLVVVLVTTLLAVWGAGTLVNKINDASAQGTAAWMLSARKAVQAYIERHAATLALAEHPSALESKGYVDWSAPSMAELKADGLLASAFPEYDSQRAGLVIRLLRRGECPGADCGVEAILYSAAPFVRRGTQVVDEQMVAQWMLATQGWGGMVSAARPQHVGGPAFRFDNPPVPGPPLPPGTVALAITAQQLGSLDFLRVRDTRDPDFQGGATIKQNLEVQQSVYVKDYLHLGAEEDEYASCTENGAIAREYMGGLLVCNNRQWRSAGWGGGGGFATNSRYGCRSSSGSSTANPVTRDCSCPPGHAGVMISDSGAHSTDEGRTTGFLCVG